MRNAMPVQVVINYKKFRTSSHVKRIIHSVLQTRKLRNNNDALYVNGIVVVASSVKTSELRIFQSID